MCEATLSKQAETKQQTFNLNYRNWIKSQRDFDCTIVGGKRQKNQFLAAFLLGDAT